MATAFEPCKPGPESVFLSTASTVGHGHRVSLEKAACPSKRPEAGSCSRSPLFPQMNMLMRLQEAANYSSPQSYDSDSNSNSHHDDILDSSLESTL